MRARERRRAWLCASASRAWFLEQHHNQRFLKPYPCSQGLGLETDACRPGAPESLAWRQRQPRLFFRGSTTGGLVREGTPYQRFHRHRLVELAADDPRMDIGFSAYLQARTRAAGRCQ